MAGHLPVEWENKHLGVRFGSDRVITREGTMEAQNEGGVFIRTPDAEQPAFIPWSDILYVQLLEELEEPGESEAMIGRDGDPRDIAGGVRA